MSEGFIHSVKVPRLYKTASSTVKKIVERKASLKELVYERKHPNVKALYALAATTLQHSSQLTQLLEKTQLLKKEPRLDQWLARVLITELIWGKQVLQSDAKPILTIKNYENQLRDELKHTTDIKKPFTKVGKPRYVRVNTLVMTVDDAIREFINDGFTLLPKSQNYQSYLESLESLSGYSFIQDFHLRELFAFAAGTHFYDHDGYKSGAIVLQDKASCLPAHLLNPPTGSVVLDMCAAPGMKTTHLAAIMQNEGKIYSVERNERRYQVLCDLIQSSGANIVTTINADSLTIDSTKYPDIEYILVDPSCSGSGMDRPELNESSGICEPSRLKSLQSFQVFLLRHALSNFPSVKRIIYSTCSIFAEENEMVIDEIINDIGDAYKLVPVKKLLNNEWINYSSVEFNCKDNCLYARQNVDYCNGFFVAVFERNFDVPLPDFKKHKTGMKVEERVDTESDSKKFDNKEKKKGKNKRKFKNFEGETEELEKEFKINESGEKKKSLDEDEKLEVKNDVGDEKNCERKKKKKKKKKKLLSEAVEVEAEAKFEVNEEENDGEICGEKKKKRKNEEAEEKSEINREENIKEIGGKKKKKRKNGEAEEKIEINGTENNEEIGSKEKKKRKNGEAKEKMEINGEENNEEIGAKKKKKRKNKEMEINNEVDNEKVIKKKKKEN
ncbi:28S rRNA (cytosine-C(5))-methyltransferase [Microplitis mediator]|uniref:28S rRNA (cytosine-C(5))-methyltransferase n=1 Tax=Microplitis mediator TaxID=375433 RepID=UPI002557A302|nr:28S rRNA (cytosine-C(5))-methyltransferase [Microplitis mediator]